MIQTLLPRWLGRPAPNNAIINKLVQPVPLEALAPFVSTALLDLEPGRLRAWKRAHPEACGPSPRQRKTIETLSTYELLGGVGPADAYLDVAGARYTYVGEVPARRRILQDLAIPPAMRARLGAGLEYIESDARAIPLPDGCIDKMSCHDAFKHFKRDSDTRFLGEVQRLLAPGGRCAISQIFVGTSYVELTNEYSFEYHLDRRAEYVVDPSATVVAYGYVRIYDVRAFRERVLEAIDPACVRARLVEVSVAGEAAPDLALAENRHVAYMNRPFRVLLLERLG